MSNLDRRGSYVPRRAREQRAYRMVVVGGGAGVVGVLGVALTIVGIVGAWLPVLAFLITAICVFNFLRITGQR